MQKSLKTGRIPPIRGLKAGCCYVRDLVIISNVDFILMVRGILKNRIRTEVKQFIPGVKETLEIWLCTSEEAGMSFHVARKTFRSATNMYINKITGCLATSNHELTSRKLKKV